MTTIKQAIQEAEVLVQSLQGFKSDNERKAL